MTVTLLKHACLKNIYPRKPYKICNTVMDKPASSMNSALDNLEEVGIVVGESSPSSFIFSVHPDLNDKVPRWEYVMVPLSRGFVIAQVQGVATYSSLLKKEMEYQALTRLTAHIVEECKHWRQARVLAYIDDINKVSSGYKRVRYAVAPGTKVYLVPDHILEKLYSGSGKTLYVGHLVTRANIKIGLSVNGFRRHVAIIAQTGAGKSYLAGVIMEELLQKGGTVIVFDPHADYVRMTEPNGEWTADLANRVTVYRVPTSISRYPSIRNVKNLSICFSDLSLEEVFYAAGIEEKFTNIRRAVTQAYNNLKDEMESGNRRSFTPRDLREQLEIISTDKNKDSQTKRDAFKAISYVSRLERLGIFGDKTTPFSEMFVPQHLSVIDLSGLSDRGADLITYMVLREIIVKKTQPEERGFKYPVFLFIEEAHRFIPPDKAGPTWSSPLIKRIAAEGRKFGIFLILISQRPSKVHQDVLSQCNSQIIMRITNPVDQRAVLEASEKLGEELFGDLPGLDKGEAIVVGDLINMPAIISVRKRRSYEGGADVNVDELLDEALRSAKEEGERKKQAEDDWEKFKRWSEPK